MIPQSHATTIPAKPKHPFRLSIPLWLVWVLLLPFILMLAPFVFVACFFVRVDPFQGVSVYWQLYWGLLGLRVEVEDPGEKVRIRIL